MSMAREAFERAISADVTAIESALLSRTKDAVALFALSEDKELSLLLEAQNYSLMAGGKRIRPVLTLETCCALGGDASAALPFACAIEMIHTYSLIHDDLPCMDNDDMRRGKPTNHKVYGEATATLAGDGLLTDAFALVSSHERVSPEIRVAAVRLLSEAAGSTGMVGGQIMDMRGESERLSLPTLRCLHARKTGALIRAAVALGALAAGYMPQKEQGTVWQALMTYAEHIGLAFQIVDDVLDVTADPALLGKSVGKDRAADKTTFLSYYSIEEAKALACELTEQACLSVAEIDRNGCLTMLAEDLAKRLY